MNGLHGTVARLLPSTQSCVLVHTIRERDKTPQLDRSSASLWPVGCACFALDVPGPRPHHDLFLSHLPFPAPLVNPKVMVSNLTPNSFVLRWPDYASDFQSGFIKGYHVYMKSKEMQCNQDWERILLSGDTHSLACSLRLKRSQSSWGPWRLAESIDNVRKKV